MNTLTFAEDDAGRIGFLADGATPLLVHQDGKIIPFIFSKDTIVLDKFLLAEKVRELERLYSDIRKGNCKNISSFGFQRNAKAM